MLDMFSNNLFTIFIIILAGIFIIYYIYQYLYGVKASQTEGADAPILLSHYTIGGQLACISRGKIVDNDYIVYVADETVIFELDLPFSLDSHLLCYSNQDRINLIEKEQMISKNMQRIILEGDFPSYFYVYCDVNNQIPLLQVFEPKNMAYIVDFCKYYDLEFYKDKIYFAKNPDKDDKNDSTTMVNDATELVLNIEPKITFWHKQHSLD